MRDVVSGSWPGQITLFGGRGRGEHALQQVLRASGDEYAAGAKLLGKDGKPVKVGKASAVAVADWDRDGDLDLLVGNYDGEVWFVPNERAGGAPDAGLVFGAKQRVHAGGVPLAVDGDAGPAVADWDGDGRLDLLLGAGDGGVRFCKGSGDAGPIELAAPLELVPPPPGGSPWEARADVDADSGALVPRVDGPRSRTKPCAADWNGDGLLDLLVGDYVYALGPEPVLDEARVEERKQVERKIGDVQERRFARRLRRDGEARRKLGIAERGELEDEPAERHAAELEKLLADDPEWAAITSEMAELERRLATLRAPRSNHGFVWVYLRRSPANDVKR